MPIQRPLQISNIGDLPTTVTLKIVPPFSCNSEVLTLPPGHKETINIDFDPGMRQDRMSGVNESKLQITHKGHPQKDFVELFGEVCYPNLNITPPTINFGTILNDTSKKRYITMTNISEMVCTYDWSFLEEETTSLNKNEDDSPKKNKKKQTPINEVFDILPVSGILKEGETETVEFTYYSGHGMKYNGIAVCSVDGGPDYQVPLVGESSFVSYKLSVSEIDFGEITYCHHDNKNFNIENVGKVPFEFNINLSTLTRPGILEVTPMSGKVMSGERFRVNLKFKPGIPDNIDEIFLVECAHFPAERFKIKAIGTYPGALLTFPRNDPTFAERCEKTKKLLEKGKVKYDAKFANTEAKQIQVNKGKQDKALIEVDNMEIEAEADRLYLCERLLEQEEILQAKTAIKFNDTVKDNSMVATKKGKTSPVKSPGADLENSGDIMAEDDDKIIVSNYMCDFGNIVVGQSKSKKFRMTNCGKNSLTFSFDTRILQQIGLSIDPAKPPKQFVPNSSMEFSVKYTTRKNAKQTKVRHLVPIHLSYGPSYTVEFVANLTIPELSLSTDNVEFNKVCVGTRKIIRVRFENKKEVPCDWFYYYKESVQNAGASKEGEKFSVYPTSGYLLPSQKQTVDIIFTPTNEKVVTQKLQFKCNHNSKLFAMNAKGYGINYAIEIIENSIEMGPVLPYNKTSEKIIELKNTMSFPIEVYSTDFDKQFTEEEDILRHYELLNTEKSDVIFEKLRKAGTEFWPNIKEADERKKKYDEM
jgi:hydrocephalus-inducing protein